MLNDKIKKNKKSPESTDQIHELSYETGITS